LRLGRQAKVQVLLEQVVGLGEELEEELHHRK
jgi:hypothetical protein